MAAYREHITVSGTLGLAFGFASVIAFGYSITQAIIAGILCWIAGMLPDLDSQSGKPVRELFGVTAALAPLLVLQHANSLGISGDRAMLFCLLLYATVRYAGAALLGKITVHRGMFHSIPALLIAAQLTFIGYHNPELHVKLLMAGAVATGFLSHLILDELYSVHWDGSRVKLKRSSGSALKFFGKESMANGLALGLLMFTSYASLKTSGLLRPPAVEAAPDYIQITEDLSDAPMYRMADEPKDTVIR